MSVQLERAERGVLGWIDRDITGPMVDFQDPDQEWRRLFSESYGTFLLVPGAQLNAEAALDDPPVKGDC